MKVIVIDDDPDVCSLVASWIHLGGHDVAAFEHPFEALDTVAAMKPDVILVDHRMPEVRGSDLIGTLRTLSPGSRIIMLTAYSNPRLVRTAVERGAESVLSKMIDRDDLLKVIELIGVKHEHP
jgi:CheY-like chemotaxis protein